MKLVIIGNGIAGNQVAFDVRKKDPRAGIVILSAEDVPEYDPCSLPYYLGGECLRADVFRKSPEDYADNRIELRYDARAVAIDPDKKRVTIHTGEQIGYDKLVLAHGGDLFVPPIPGIDNSGVFSCKQLTETQKLADHKGTSAVVIGSGAIGIEAAEALKRKGYEVYVIELMDWILPSLFDEATARRLETELTGYGIQVFTHEKVMEITGHGQVTGVVTDRRTIDCDTVVVATGVVPGTALAQTAGIETGRGIQVNRQMQTSVPDIYACGDCVETIDACTGEIAMFQLKHNAIEQAQVTARHILGEPVRYLGAYAFARAHFFDTHAATFGKTQRALDCVFGDKRIVEREDKNNYLRVVLLDNQIVGGQAIGTFANDLGLLIGAMWRKDDFLDIAAKMRTLPKGGAAHAWPMVRLGRVLGM
ncbi:MAG: NAD(P)/FAD-dependent oxidoreductase [Thermodesulfobacteriota bacterium]